MSTHQFVQRSFVRVAATVAMVLSTQLLAANVYASDPVLDWIGIANNSAIAAGSSPLVTVRIMSIVSASVYDAVNGIDPHYRPLHVRPNAPSDASAKAAAVQAAYNILVKSYPSQSAALLAKHDASIAAIALTEDEKSILAGMAWGDTVANPIWTYRLGDGIAPPPPPFIGALGIESLPGAVGVWRPTPPVNAYGAGPQFATMTPWVLQRPSQFRLPPPNAVTSAQYAADYNETKTMGAFNGSPRTSDQSEYALFWNGNTPLYWNRIAAQIADERSLSLSEKAHLFALLNVTMLDAAIACWDTKYRYVFWRPITAIQLGDGVAATEPDPAWTPWLNFFASGTPAHPEYPSGHSTVSGSAAAVLTAMFGDDTSFTVTSDVRPGTRSFHSFSEAVAEIANARVYGGIHFRTSCTRGNALGEAVAKYVMRHAMRAEEE